MSPYRVIVRDKLWIDDKTQVLQASLQVNKLTGTRYIVIVLKRIEGADDTVISDKYLAYRYRTKRNSVLLDKYQIVDDLDPSGVAPTYYTEHCNPWYRIRQDSVTQQNCLRIAMKDYCETHCLEITEVL